MAEKSKKASGLKIVRKDNKFTASWKQPSGGYKNSQRVDYKINDGKWIKKTDSVNAKSANITITKSSYYPYSEKPKLKKVSFRVKGKQQGKSESEYTIKDFDVKTPPKPKVTSSVSTWPKAIFAWEVKTKDSDNAWFTRVEYQSVLKKDMAKSADKLPDEEWDSTYPGSQKKDEKENVDKTSGSVQIEEPTELFEADQGKASFTRYFRIRSLGPNGDSKWSYGRHIYAKPLEPEIISDKWVLYDPSINNKSTDKYKYYKDEFTSFDGSYGIFRSIVKNDNGTLTANVQFHSNENPTHPVDSFDAEYVIADLAENLDPPSGLSGFTNAKNFLVKDKEETSFVTFDTPQCLENQGLYVRIVAKYDGNTVPSPAVLLWSPYGEVYKLSKPTLDYAHYNLGSTTVTMKATNTATNVTGVKLLAFYIDVDYPDGIELGELSSGIEQSFNCPAIKEQGTFSVRAVLKSYPDGRMVGSEEAFETSPPVPDVSLDRTDTPGVLQVSWDWPNSYSSTELGDISAAEVSWSDRKDAWNSTDEPSTYIVDRGRNSFLNINGLETGVEWFVRVRFIKGTGDSVFYSRYSELKSKLLSTKPLVPVVTITPDTISEDETATISWVYSTTDGSDQGSAEVGEILVSGEEPMPLLNGTVSGNSKKLEITPSELGWANGTDHQLAVITTSENGLRSEAWSAPYILHIVAKPEIDISSPSLVVNGDGVKELKAMPLTVNVTATAETMVSVIVERKGSYHNERPDESNLDGYDGETIAASTLTGSGTVNFVIGENILGRFDDGGEYRIIATAQDNYGQTSTTYPIDPETGKADYNGYQHEFTINWTHQAAVPTATVSVDDEAEIATLTPIAPTTEDNILRYSSRSSFPATGEAKKLYIDESNNDMYWYENGEYIENTDTCDIYRLSVDKPVLIYEGAEFGKSYIDPFPTIGYYGGHRFVTVTSNGDYTIDNTSTDGNYAWTDTKEEHGDVFEIHSNIIDFGEDKVHLLYEVDISNNWSKDFKETKYLGGSVQGDWNPAVSRTSTVSFTAVPDLPEDQALIESMRRLAVYPGICHVRTKDGSSYSADVSVNETYKYTRAPRLNEYSLSITRVDSQRLDGYSVE